MNYIRDEICQFMDPVYDLPWERVNKQLRKTMVDSVYNLTSRQVNDRVNYQVYHEVCGQIKHTSDPT